MGFFLELEKYSSFKGGGEAFYSVETGGYQSIIFWFDSWGLKPFSSVL